MTVDPERDTPERLGLHVNAFNPDFIGLTGTEDELTPVYEAFDVYFEKDESSGSALGYLVNHTATVFVVDQIHRHQVLSNATNVYEIDCNR